MKFIRKVLFCSLDHEWTKSIYTDFCKIPKIKAHIASTRSESSHLLSENNFDMIIFEDSFTVKNIELTMRAIQGLQKNPPPFVVFLSYDFQAVANLDLPKNLGINYLFYSLPLLKDEVTTILNRRLFPGTGSKGSINFDLEFIEILIQSAKKAIETILVDANLIINSPIRLEETKDLDVKIRGKIMMKNDFFSGSFFVSFPEMAYLNLRKQVLDETETTIDDNNSDFAGELANIIYGQTKKELHENGINLEMVIPTSDRSPSLHSKHPIIIIPIDSSFGRFYIKLAKDLY